MLLVLGLGLSSAPAQVSPGTALRFDGANGYVDAGNNASFNAFPLTISAWIRTTNVNPTAQGIVSKYFDASYNGYSIHLVNGRINAWYLRNTANYVLAPGAVPIDGGFIADGRWHHVVFAVDTAGARVFVDGARTAIASWTGPAGPPTQTLPLQIGRYHNYVGRFRGDLDEVSLWNQSLETNAVNYIKHRSLSGREDGLVALWKFDEGSGSTTMDSTPSARVATLISNPEWVASTAPIALSPVAGSSVKFDGVDDQLSVAHDNALNAYPLSVTAWIKTSRVAASYNAVVNKYPAGSGNG